MNEHEQAKAVLNMQNKIDLYEMALQKIKDEQGVVCQKFESCKHASCRSSYASWAIADIALKECSE
ncbi:MAG: hypothetical protein KAS32_10550 [Candidatus Peribacteraceae bacterium]|nr:hypothetical protein [Candidatus Peribacteraceae bacterium]